VLKSMARYDRRLRKLEARLTDRSGFVSRTEPWLEYWRNRVDRVIIGQEAAPPGCIPLDVIDIVVAANESCDVP